MQLTTQAVAVDIVGQRIVEDVSLHIENGEMVGLIGPNGSGKSTLLRTVYRLLRPVAGYVRVGGDDVWQMSARESAQRTGVVVQEAPSDFEFTVREIVEMGRTPHKGRFSHDTRDDMAIVEQALQRVQMNAFANRQYHTLSGGEKQRMLVARALAQQPKVLVLDEPTNHLDIHYQLEILDLVRALGLTTLVTLHDLNLAAAYCQRLYLLKQGHIVAAGPPEAVLTPALIREVFNVDAVVGQHPITGAPHLSFVALDTVALETR
ncbi:MAG: ABC transporter ATP-binding protein [Chloroflexi bacterium AL-W]|nr:ABC transporter ATP-binding protein [Chloroflexi bacterium AL-N1]NOK64645.1 ABC transporter ATP-binding protein [Chloroflexi bacterium AL-N10]NOK75886.1 ABC transporter ATP-binding protein [Chloroflexi bacterium AL-N5]NOK80356.1 ABC transporter ATP-binding protein [Chloroflexi bacterium AL-W]NOK86869.1 ABC transporter ATP-binding protein [Chloroflexi bacterium AL-N15]